MRRYALVAALASARNRTPALLSTSRTTFPDCVMEIGFVGEIQLFYNVPAEVPENRCGTKYALLSI